MKILNYLAFVAALFAFASCQNESLDKEAGITPPYHTLNR